MPGTACAMSACLDLVASLQITSGSDIIYTRLCRWPRYPATTSSPSGANHISPLFVHFPSTGEQNNAERNTIGLRSMHDGSGIHASIAICTGMHPNRPPFVLIFLGMPAAPHILARRCQGSIQGRKFPEYPSDCSELVGSGTWLNCR